MGKAEYLGHTPCAGRSRSECLLPGGRRSGRPPRSHACRLPRARHLQSAMNGTFLSQECIADRKRNKSGFSQRREQGVLFGGQKNI
jgi:hypothetical protein